jgi:hypothetical protein
MNQDNIYSNDYVYSLQQLSEVNCERAERAEEELEALKDELAKLQLLVVPADTI